METNRAEVSGNGHKSNWITVLKNHLGEIKAVTDLLPDGGALSDLAAILEDTGTSLPATLATIASYLDTEIAAIKAVIDLLPDAGALTSLAQDATVALDATVAKEASLAALALEATLTAIKGGGWTTETLVALKAAIDAIPAGGDATEAKQDIITTHLTDIKGGGWATETLVAIKAAIDAIAGVNSYQEQIPDVDFDLAVIDDDLTAPPPTADAENSVVDIDENAGNTFVLRSLWVKITSFGTTGGTKLTFSLWTLVKGVVTEVDSVDVDTLGIQNLMDLFGLQEVHADGIWITVVTDATDEPGDAACEGSYRWAKAS